MDPNIVVVCVTVVIVALLLSATVIGAAGSYERAHRPIRLANLIAEGLRGDERGDGDERDR